MSCTKKYKLTYIVDGETYKEIEMEFGAAINPEIPEKEGHTFSGWDGLPQTMPSHDVVASGSFTINSYTLTIYLNNEIYSSEEIEYGSPITIATPTVPDGMKFDGWTDEIPETMPAHDVDIHGEYSPLSAITNVCIDSDTDVTVYTLAGHALFINRPWQEVKDRLPNGYLLINNKIYLIQK